MSGSAAVHETGRRVEVVLSEARAVKVAAQVVLNRGQPRPAGTAVYLPGDDLAHGAAFGRIEVDAVQVTSAILGEGQSLNTVLR